MNETGIKTELDCQKQKTTKFLEENFDLNSIDLEFPVKKCNRSNCEICDSLLEGSTFTFKSGEI